MRRSRPDRAPLLDITITSFFCYNCAGVPLTTGTKSFTLGRKDDVCCLPLRALPTLELKTLCQDVVFPRSTGKERDHDSRMGLRTIVDDGASPMDKAGGGDEDFGP